MNRNNAAIHASLSCNLEPALLQASLPLFQEERVAAVEWSFDTLFKMHEIPEWFTELIRTYSDANRLIGHGVYFSLLSAKWMPGQQAWLDRLKKLCTEFQFEHISEHFGFMTGANFHQGAPMSVPWNEKLIRIGMDRLQRLYEACQCPVGLENLAYASSPDDVYKHGEYLTRLIDPVNGFILLDLHNLYCQWNNFSADPWKLIQAYPLERVREIHISGGSWEMSTINPPRKIRRDTHDDAVPKEVFTLLKEIIPHCPNLNYVVLEQLGSALETSSSQEQFREDFYQLQSILNSVERGDHDSGNCSFLPKSFEAPGPIPPEDLYAAK